MIKCYVEKIYPGIIVSESSTEECPDRNPDSVVVDERMDGFRFFDREVTDGETGELFGKRHNESPWYYFGTVKTLEEIAVEQPDSVLHRNMVNNGYDRVVETRHGQSYPLDDNAIVLPEADDEKPNTNN